MIMKLSIKILLVFILAGSYATAQTSQQIYKAAGTPVNVIRVEPQIAHHALVALERMLQVR